LRQPLTAPLIVWIGLTFVVMAALEQDGGKRPIAAPRDVQIGGDEQVRPALVDDLLDFVLFPFQRSGGARVQRSALLNASNELPKRFPDPLLTSINGCRGDKFREFRIPPIDSLLSEAAKIIGKATRVGMEGRSGKRRQSSGCAANTESIRGAAKRQGTQKTSPSELGRRPHC
jgi:hypothetical protein